MGLQANQNHVLGARQKFFQVKEATPGTFIKAATGHSANCLTTSFVPNVGRKDRLDAYMPSRTVTERITGTEEHSWSYEGHWIPSGTKNIAPDIGDMVLAATGSETVNANDVTYALTSSQQITTLSMTRHFQEIFQEALAGAWVEEMKWNFAGGEEPKVSFSGGAMSYAATGYSTLDAEMTTPWTTMQVQPEDLNLFMTNPNAAGSAGQGARSVVKIDDGSDPYTDIEVTVDNEDATFTVTAGGTDDQADDAAVTPYVPTHTDLGSPITGVTGAYDIWDVTPANFTAKITAFEFTHKNNFKPNSDQAFAARVTDVIASGMREVTGSMTFRVRQDHIEHILNRRQLATRQMRVLAGGAAQSGTSLDITFPACELLWSEAQVPQTEEATINVPFKALGTGTGNNEYTIVHS
jgi:hypothetical protein